jgi:pimeloyl-ACP methyl ester carboxylesterase
MAFMWPCHCNRLAYTSARGKVAATSDVLLRLIKMLRGRGCSVTVVGHSLGCRIALAALSSDTLLQQQDPLVDNLLLAGAAVASDCFTNEFPSGRVSARSLVAFSSSHDEVLSSYFRTGELLARITCQPQLWSASVTALGLVGMTSGPAERCTSVDVSGQVPSHSVHAYFSAPEFHERLVSIVHLDGAVGGVMTSPEQLGRIASLGSAYCDSDGEEDQSGGESGGVPPFFSPHPRTFTLNSLLETADGDVEAEAALTLMFERESDAGSSTVDLTSVAAARHE